MAEYTIDHIKVGDDAKKPLQDRNDVNRVLTGLTSGAGYSYRPPSIRRDGNPIADVSIAPKQDGGFTIGIRTEDTELGDVIKGYNDSLAALPLASEPARAADGTTAGVGSGGDIITMQVPYEAASMFVGWAESLERSGRNVKEGYRIDNTGDGTSEMTVQFRDSGTGAGFTSKEDLSEYLSRAVTMVQNVSRMSGTPSQGDFDAIYATVKQRGADDIFSAHYKTRDGREVLVACTPPAEVLCVSDGSGTRINTELLESKGISLDGLGIAAASMDAAVRSATSTAGDIVIPLNALSDPGLREGSDTLQNLGLEAVRFYAGKVSVKLEGKVDFEEVGTYTQDIASITVNVTNNISTDLSGGTISGALTSLRDTIAPSTAANGRTAVLTAPDAELSVSESYPINPENPENRDKATRLADNRYKRRYHSEPTGEEGIYKITFNTGVINRAPHKVTLKITDSDITLSGNQSSVIALQADVGFTSALARAAAPDGPDGPGAGRGVPPDGPPGGGAALAARTTAPVSLIDFSQPDTRSVDSLVDSLNTDPRYYVVDPDGTNPAEKGKRGEYKIYDRSPRSRSGSTHLATLTVGEVITGSRRHPETVLQAKMTYYDGPADNVPARDAVRDQLQGISDIVDKTSAAVTHNPAARPDEAHKGDIEPAEPRRPGRSLMSTNVTREALNMLQDAQIGTTSLLPAYPALDAATLATLSIVPVEAGTKKGFRGREVTDEDRPARTQIRQGDKILAVITGNPNDTESNFEPDTRYAEGPVAAALQQLFNNVNDKQLLDAHEADPGRPQPKRKGVDPSSREALTVFRAKLETEAPYKDDYKILNVYQKGTRKIVAYEIVDAHNVNNIVMMVTNEKQPKAKYSSEAVATTLGKIVGEINTELSRKDPDFGYKQPAVPADVVLHNIDAVRDFAAFIGTKPGLVFDTIQEEKSGRLGVRAKRGEWVVKTKEGAPLMLITGTGVRGESPTILYLDDDKLLAPALKAEFIKAVDAANTANPQRRDEPAAPSFTAEHTFTLTGVMKQLIADLPGNFRLGEKVTLGRWNKRHEQNIIVKVLGKDELAAKLVWSDKGKPVVHYYKDKEYIVGGTAAAPEKKTFKTLVDEAEAKGEAAWPDKYEQAAAEATQQQSARGDTGSRRDRRHAGQQQENAADVAAWRAGTKAPPRRYPRGLRWINSGDTALYDNTMKEKRREDRRAERQTRRDNGEPMGDRAFAASTAAVGAVGAFTAGVLASRGQSQDNIQAAVTGERPKERMFTKVTKVLGLVLGGAALLAAVDAAANKGKITGKIFGRD